MHTIQKQLVSIYAATAPVDAFEHDAPHFGDHFIDPSLTSRFQHEVGKRLVRDASVLIPIITDGTNLDILLTKRPMHFTVHPGRWCFPGGKMDPEDASKKVTALRETWEEVGIPASKIRVLGRLPNFWVCIDIDGKPGFNLSGFIGLIQKPISLNLNADEVSDVMHVPLHDVLTSKNITIVDGEFNIPHQGKIISGSTAALLVMLRNLLAGRAPLMQLSGPAC